jgi:hydrogenase nickel incorporation protein HypA/HybF
MPDLKPDVGNLKYTWHSLRQAASMHEFSRTQNLLDLALEKSNSKRIVRVNLVIGSFSEEREESIRFYWRDLAKGSPGEGAELKFNRLPVEMKCLDCSGAFDPEATGERSMCEYCFGEHLRLLSEDDVRLESIEVE